MGDYLVEAGCIADLVLVDLDDAIRQACRAAVDIDGVGQLLAGIGLVVAHVEAVGLEHVHQGHGNPRVAVP